MPPQRSQRSCQFEVRNRNTIRHYRLRLGLTQAELARELEVRPSTVSEWERGLTCPSAEPLLRLAKTLSTLAEALYPQFYLRRSADRQEPAPSA